MYLGIVFYYLTRKLSLNAKKTLVYIQHLPVT
jgi:hypothetical protein